MKSVSAESERQRWQSDVLDPALKKSPERTVPFTTVSGPAMERLFAGISVADVTTSMTINSPAPMILAMYLVLAEKQGADWKALSGTIQNDILKEFIAQKEYIYPPRESMRLITDVFTFCAR